MLLRPIQSFWGLEKNTLSITVIVCFVVARHCIFSRHLMFQRLQ